MRSRLYGQIVILFCVAVLVCACIPGGPITLKEDNTPTVVTQPTFVPYRPFRVVQVCLDTPPLYPSTDFHQAANKIADWIEGDVTVNQGGFIVYVGEITSQSFQSEVIPPIQVAGFPADTAEPTPLPTYTAKPGENPYQAANIEATVDAKNTHAYNDWQNGLKKQHNDVATTLAEVKQETEKLRTLSPIYDNKAADVFGCLQNASQVFRSSQGEKYLIIASAFVNNTAVNITPDLNLYHAHVYGIWRECPTAEVCYEHDNRWKATFAHIGADPNVIFYAPNQSETLPSLF